MDFIRKGILLSLVIAVSAGAYAGSPAPADTSAPPRFGELFLYGLVVLEPGGGSVIYPDKRPPAVSKLREIIVPTNAAVETKAGETANLRLDCGSRITLAPLSKVVIRRFAIDLGKGECLVRHIGSQFPIKITGEVSLLVTRDSLAEVARDEKGFGVRVQAGTVQVGHGGQELKVGQAALIEGKSVRRSPIAIPLRAWATGGTFDSGARLPLPEIFDSSDEDSGLPASQAGEGGKPDKPKSGLLDRLRNHSIDTPGASLEGDDQ